MNVDLTTVGKDAFKRQIVLSEARLSALGPCIRSGFDPGVLFALCAQGENRVVDPFIEKLIPFLLPPIGNFGYSTPVVTRRYADEPARGQTVLNDLVRD